LVEFVRIGVQLLHDELAGFREAVGGEDDEDGRPIALH